MAKPKILVTRRWPAAVEARLTEEFDAVLHHASRPLDTAGFREAFAGFDAVIPSDSDRITDRALDLPRPRARILANGGVRSSHICLEGARRHGMTITNTPGVMSDCTADLAMTLLMMVARRTGEGDRAVRAGLSGSALDTDLIGRQVSGKTLGIVGFGRVGQRLAARAHHGFGMKVLVQDVRRLDADALRTVNAVQVDSLETLLPMCDAVSLHCSDAARNRHLINADSLNRMRDDAILINTSHGSVVDERALAQALWFETIGGAGLDLTDDMPTVVPDLRDCDRLVMLPHQGSATREAQEAMGFRMLENLTDFFAGRTPKDLVN